MKRLLGICFAVIMAVTMLSIKSFAEDFDTENFAGVVLTVEDSSLTVEMWKNVHSKATQLTPVYTDTENNAYYFEVIANQAYYYVAKPVNGASHYSLRKNFYITAEDAQKKTVWDVTPPVRTDDGWDPTEVKCYADAVMEKAFPSSPNLWPDYVELLKVPALTNTRTDHRMTTQTEMMDYICDLDGAADNMYVFTLGKSGGPSNGQLDIPVVFYSKTDLSGAKTWQEAAALLRANGKLSVLYQAQVHGNEPASGEAALAMLKAFDGSYGEGLIENINICVMPRLNTYGAYKASRYVYYNGKDLDPNRDFLKLDSNEVQLRNEIFLALEPEICFDTHEYNLRTGNVNVDMQDMQLSTNFTQMATDDFREMALTMCYEAFDRAEENNLGYGWYNDTVNGFNPSTGTTGVAMRGSFVFLTETNGLGGGNQQLERRMMGHISMVTGILDYVNKNTAAVQKVVDDHRAYIVERGKTYEDSDFIVLQSGGQEHIEHYFNGKQIDTASGVITDNVFTANIYDLVLRSRTAPTAYVIPAGESWSETVIENLTLHGISYTKIPAGSVVQLQQYIEDGTNESGMTLAALTDETYVSFPYGAYVMTMDQKDAYIMAVRLEPDVDDVSEYTGTFVQEGIIAAENGKFPIYRYIQNLNEEGFIAYTQAAAAPTGLRVEGAAVIGGVGKILGLDASMTYEYRSVDAEEYTAVAAGNTEIADLALGNYFVRYAATQDAQPSADATITIGYDLDEYIVYVDSTNGTKTNNAYTEATAASTYSVAKGQLDLLMKYAPAGTTGVIKICGTYTMTKSSTGLLSLQEHDYPLLITGGTLVFKDSANSQKWLRMGGDTTFDNITIKPGTSSAAYFLCGNGHKLTIGPNVTSVANGSYYFNIMGGLGEYSNNQYVSQTDVTILSGTWRYVYAGGYVSGVTETAKAQLSNCSVARIYGSHNGHLHGDVYLSLDNVTVRDNEIYCGNTQKNNVSGNVTLVLGENINADNVYAGSKTEGDVLGTVTIITNGVDMTTTTIHGKANNTTGSIGGLALELRQGQLANVAESFITRDGVSVKLGCAQTQSVKLPYDIDLDLNGYDLSVDLNGCDISAVGNGALVCSDSKTDDFDVADGEYGAVSAGANLQAAPGYLAVTEDGKTSFHKYEMALTSLIVNTGNSGISYASTFKGDQKVKAQVREFGIAMQAYTAPSEGSIRNDIACKTHVPYLTNSPEHGWVIGDNSNTVKTVFVTNILAEGLSDDDNKERAEVPIYGRSYMILKNGTMLLSEVKNEEAFSMKTAMEHMNSYWNETDGGKDYISSDAKEMLVAFYRKYQNVMNCWNISNIVTAAK